MPMIGVKRTLRSRFILTMSRSKKYTPGNWIAEFARCVVSLLALLNFQCVQRVVSMRSAGGFKWVTLQKSTSCAGHYPSIHVRVCSPSNIEPVCVRVKGFVRLGSFNFLMNETDASYNDKHRTYLYLLKLPYPLHLWMLAPTMYDGLWISADVMSHVEISTGQISPTWTSPPLRCLEAKAPGCIEEVRVNEVDLYEWWALHKGGMLYSLPVYNVPYNIVWLPHIWVSSKMLIYKLQSFSFTILCIFSARKYSQLVSILPGPHEGGFNLFSRCGSVWQCRWQPTLMGAVAPATRRNAG